MPSGPLGTLPAELEQARDLLELLQQNASDGFVLTDDAGRLMFINAKTVEMIGRPPEEALGRHFLEFTPADRRELHLEYFNRLVSGEKEIRLRTELTKKDGGLLPVEITATMVEWRDRRIAFGIIRDATLQIARERKIEEDKKFLELLQENATEGIVLTRAAGEIVYVNPRLCEIMKQTREQMVGHNFLDLSKPSERERHWAYHQGILAGDKSTIRTREVRTDGQEVILDISSSLVERGGERYTFAIIRDVTTEVYAEERLSLYREIFANSIDGVATIDLQGRYLEQNEAHRTLLGYSDRELAGRTPAIHMGEEAFARVAGELQASGRFRGELASRSKSGKDLFVELSAFVVKNASGEPVCYVGIKRDVSARKQAERDLLFQKSLLECQSESSIDGILVVSPDGRMISFNRRFVEMWGIPEEVLRTRSDDKAIQSVLSTLEDPEAFLARIRHLYEHPDERSQDELRLRDGRVFDRYSVPIRGTEGIHLGRVWYFRDVTDRRRAERRLAAQHALTRVLSDAPTLAEAAPAILSAMSLSLGWEAGLVWVVDRDGGELRCLSAWHRPGAEVGEFENVSLNRTFIRGVGLPGRVWAGGAPVWIPDVTVDGNFPRAPFALNVGLHAGFGFPIRSDREVLGMIEFFSREIKTPDEELLRMVDSIGSQVGQFMERKRADGEALKSAAETKRAYEKLKRTQARLVQSEKLASVGMLVSGVAHQINNPINVMYGNLKLMKGRGAGRGRAAGMLADALKAAEEAKEVLEVFRNFARDARVAEPCDLNRAIERVLGMSRRWLKSVDVEFVPGRLPPVRCFPGQIHQVLLNLVKNAVEAMGTGGLRRLSIRSSRRGRSVFVDIGDSGAGIPRPLRRRIFDPFFTTKAEGQGMGLGLTISASILEHHGGRLSLRSTSKRGTTFRIQLPVR